MEAFQKRIDDAAESLQKAVRSVDGAVIVKVRFAGKMESKMVYLVSRASQAFIDGMLHVWLMETVLMS